MKMKTVLTVLLGTVLIVRLAAGVQEGLAAMQQGDYQTAYKEFYSLAVNGDDKAMLTIGIFFQQGQGVPADYEKAMFWYLKALEKKNYNGMNNIGVLYRDGLGVKPDLSLAYALFTAARKHLRNDSDISLAEKNLWKTDMIISKDEITAAKKLTDADLTPGKLRTRKPAAVTAAPAGRFPEKFLDSLPQTYTLDREKTDRAFQNVKVKFVYENDFAEYPGFVGQTIGKQKDLQNEVIKKGGFISKDGNFRVRIPHLSSGEVEIYRTSRRNRIDQEVKFFEKNIKPLDPWPVDRGAGHAVVITTKLPAVWKKQSGKILDIMEKTQRQNAAWLPKDLYRLIRINGTYGPVLQLAVLNRIPSVVYPQTEVYISPIRDGLKTIGVNRIFVTDNLLVELGIIVARPANMDDRQFLEYALNQMDLFMGGFEVIKEEVVKKLD